MSHQKSLSIALLLLVVLWLLVHFLTPMARPGVEHLRFSTTQSEPFFAPYFRGKRTFTADTDYEDIIISAPPPNTAQQTQEELYHLLRLMSERSPEALEMIDDEATHVMQFRFDGDTLHDMHQSDAKRPLAELLIMSLTDLDPYIGHFKRKFDRVRPSFLEPAIDPVIAVPRHAAYPSGHATQSHLIAHILTLCDPKRQDVYFSDAAGISIRREIAGVHYPSDSDAGQNLARQHFTILENTPTFQEVFLPACATWHGTNQSMLPS